MLNYYAPYYPYFVGYQTTNRRTCMTTVLVGCIEAPYVSWSSTAIRLFVATTEGCLIMYVRIASRVTNVIAVFVLAVGISAPVSPVHSVHDDGLWAVPVPVPRPSM